MTAHLGFGGANVSIKSLPPSDYSTNYFMSTICLKEELFLGWSLGELTSCGNNNNTII